MEAPSESGRYIGARVTIRRIPEDFRVEELSTEAFRASLATDWSASHPFAAYTLEKTSLATPDALAFIARELRIPGDCVQAAGIKDRHAQTRQTITIDTAGLRGAAPTALRGALWSLRALGFARRRADSSLIEANRFSIVVRGLTKRASDEMERRATVLREADGDLLFVNYFGDQRFGSNRHHQGWVGRALVDGDFESALRLAIGTPARKDSGPTRALTRALANHWGDWETALAHFGRLPERGAVETLARGGTFKDAFAALPRFTQQICVDAYQSHLWNGIARAFARAIAESTAERAFEADDPFGPLVFPRVGAFTPAVRGLRIPPPSAKATMPACIAVLADELLAAEGIELARIRIPEVAFPSFGGDDRPFVVAARNWTMSPPRHDDFAGNSPANLARTVRFELPRGSYATVLLRALGQ